MNGARDLVLRVLGTPVVVVAATTLTRTQLRILAYHDVPDSVAFAHQMGYLADRYNPVDPAHVLAAVSGEVRLPRRAVWVTFDDGDPSVVESGQPVLDRYGIRATLFVCPGVVDTDQPFWWQVVGIALGAGITVRLGGRTWTDKRLITYLKTLSDEERRAIVATLLADLVGRTGTSPARRQVTTQQLSHWVDGGHRLGNHTWDHPCLDRCSPEEQERQVYEAARWLATHLPGVDPVFAYPNGNWSPRTEAALAASGCCIGLEFDHRLARVTEPPLHWSRLRVDTWAPLNRFRAIVSGAHPGLYHAARIV
ncbi:MAG: polysaccharide deacetylase family protein, partial [Pseudonocardiaceae bacterium]